MQTHEMPFSDSPPPHQNHESSDRPTAVGQSTADDVRQSLEDVYASTEQLVRVARTFVGKNAADRPYVVLGTALGVGFILGGGLASGATRSLLGLAGRVAILNAMKAVSPDAPHADTSL